MTAEEASKLSEEVSLTVDWVEEETKHIDYWIEVCARHGKDNALWWVPKEMPETHVKKVVQHFKSKGFEASEETNIVRRVTFTW